MSLETFAAGHGIHVATALVAFVSGFVPLINTEAYLLATSALAPGWQAVPIVLLATLGQMAAKTTLFFGARYGFGWFAPRQERLDHWREKLARDPRGKWLLVTSAFVGLPPFYALSVAAGALRWPYLPFALAGTGGRLFRFTLVFLAPQLLRTILGTDAHVTIGP